MKVRDEYDLHAVKPAVKAGDSDILPDNLRVKTLSEEAVGEE